MRRTVHLADYVRGSGDEGVNCSRYRNGEIEARVEARVREREEEDDADYSCPIEPDRCVGARERYGDYAPRLLHPECIRVEAAPRRWWKFW